MGPVVCKYHIHRLFVKPSFERWFMGYPEFYVSIASARIAAGDRGIVVIPEGITTMYNMLRVPKWTFKADVHGPALKPNDRGSCQLVVWFSEDLVIPLDLDGMINDTEWRDHAQGYGDPL